MFTKTILTEETVMYRVSGGKAGEVGSYVSRTPQGGGLQSQLDLAYICDVNLEAGIKLRSGEVNPLFGFDGGGQQFDLIINGKNVGTFINERMIGQ